MQRREFIAAVATAAVVTAAAPRAGAGAPVRAMGEEPPAGKYAALESAAGACIEAGEACLRHCFDALASKDTAMAACADAVYELITASRAVKSLAAANSAHVPIFAKALAQTCLACRFECDKFAGIAECEACGEACAKCADECRTTA
jgi:Cys-rich four helix bundle protein (predicted Tat secretion target)